MSGIILIIIAVFLAANGDYTLFWVFGGLVVLYLIAALFGETGGSRPARRGRPRTRIDIPHYMSEDESVCTVCGRRIPAYMPSCPNCGVRFNAVRENTEKWDEEFDEMEAWDEEEGW